MNLSIRGPNIKVFAKAIQSLAKIGHELSVETSQNDIVLRTFNSSQCVFANFVFNATFFTQYQETNSIKLKVSLKSCLMAFRSLPSMEKSVEKCSIDTNSLDSILIIEFHCKHGMTKVYHLPILSDDIVQAIDYTNDIYLCELSVQSSLFSNGVQNFNSGVEEVILAIYNDKVILKNHIDKDLEQGKTVQTELTFDSEEFELFSVSREVELMFCLKEFKTILNFAEGFNVPLVCKCPVGGKPIVFSISDITGLEPNFVLATISAGSESLPSTAVQRLNVSGNSNVQTKRKKNKKAKKGPHTQVHDLQSTSDHISHILSPENRVLESQNSARQNSSGESDNDVVLNDDDYDLRLNNDDNLRPNNDDDLRPNNDDEIPTTPPNKKFRLAFLGLYQSSQHTVIDSQCEVLAAASDDDED